MKENICFIAALITISTLIIKIVKYGILKRNLVLVIAKNIFNPIYKYTPLLMAILIPLCGVLLFALAPLAFTEQYHISQNICKAYAAFVAFTLFAVGCFPLSKFMYTEYKDINRNLPF